MKPFLKIAVAIWIAGAAFYKVNGAPWGEVLLWPLYRLGVLSRSMPGNLAT